MTTTEVTTETGSAEVPKTATDKKERSKGRTDIRYFHDGRSMPESHKSKLSTVAYFYSKDLVAGQPTRCSTKDFIAALAKAGVADPGAPGWMVKLPNGITIECRVEGEKSQYSGPAPARKATGAKKATAAKKTPAKKATPKKQTPGQKARESAKPAARMVTPLPKKSASKRASRTPARKSA